MKPIKKWNKELFRLTRENIVLLFLSNAVLVFVTYAFSAVFRSFAEKDNVTLSMADYFLIAKQPYFFYLANTFLSVIILSFVCKRQFRINYIIRQKSLKTLFIHQCYIAAVMSLFFSILQTIVSAIIAVLNCNIGINFSEKNSYFYYHTDGYLNDFSFIQIIALTFFAGFFCMTLMNILFVILKWIFKHDATCIMIMLLIGFIDSVSGRGVVTYFGATYEQFVPAYSYTTLIIPPILAAAVFLLGMFIANKKEFLHAK